MMKRNILILVCLLALTGLYTWFDSGYGRMASPLQDSPAQTSGTTLLEASPDFAFQALDGSKHKLSDFRGKVVILNFWASWCAPCVIEFPQMIDLAKAKEGKAILLFLSQDEDEDAIKRFLKKHAPELSQENIYVALDREQKTARALYQTYKLPETYLIGRDGRIAEKIIGADVVWNGAAMKAKIDDLYGAN